MQRVGNHHVVVGQSVDEEQGTLQPRRLHAQVGPGVVLRLDRRIAQVPLGVVGVVEPPVGDRRTGDRSVEHVGSSQHGQGGQVAAERPAPDGHTTQVQPVVDRRQGLQGIDLVVEHGGRQVAVHSPLPFGSTPGCAPAVGDDHGEPLVGEPLRGQELPSGPLHPLGVRPAVGIQQHRQGRPVVPVRYQHGGPEVPLPDHVEGGFRSDHRLLDIAGDQMAPGQDNGGRRSVHAGRRHHDHTASDSRRSHTAATGQHLGGSVEGHPNHVDVQRVGRRPHDNGTFAVDPDHRTHLQPVRGHGRPVDHQPVGARPGFHRHDGAVDKAGSARHQVHPEVVHQAGPLDGRSGVRIHLEDDQRLLIPGLGNHGRWSIGRPRHVRQVLEPTVDLPVHIGRGPVQVDHS